MSIANDHAMSSDPLVALAASYAQGFADAKVPSGFAADWQPHYDRAFEEELERLREEAKQA